VLDFDILSLSYDFWILGSNIVNKPANVWNCG